jgi:ATP-dependent Clp protease ATP-binding subunit ClpC
VAVFERFTNISRISVGRANQETHRLGGNIIGDVELLLGLVNESRGVANIAMRQLGVDLSKLKVELEKQPRSLDDGKPPRKLPQTRELKLAIQSAIELAREMGHKHVGTEHMLLALVRDSSSAPSRILASHGVAFDRVKQTVADLAAASPQGEE